MLATVLTTSVQLYMCLTDRCQVESASHMAVTKSVKRLNTHIIFEIICI